MGSGGSDSDDALLVKEYPEFTENLDQPGEVKFENGLIFPTTKHLRKAL